MNTNFSLTLIGLFILMIPFHVEARVEDLGLSFVDSSLKNNNQKCCILMLEHINSAKKSSLVDLKSHGLGLSLDSRVTRRMHLGIRVDYSTDDRLMNTQYGDTRTFSHYDFEGAFHQIGSYVSLKHFWTLSTNQIFFLMDLGVRRIEKKIISSVAGASTAETEEFSVANHYYSPVTSFGIGYRLVLGRIYAVGLNIRVEQNLKSAHKVPLQTEDRNALGKINAELNDSIDIPKYVLAWTIGFGI